MHGVRLALFGSIAILAAAEARAQPVQEAPGKLVAVRAAAFVDVRAGKLVPEAVLLVRGERIEACGSAQDVVVPEGAELVDLGQLVLLPGLIDAHVHLAWGAARPGQPLPGTDEARLTLEAGFTTVRNLGSTARADLALQHAIEAGEVPGPRMLVAVSGIGPRGGVCAGVFAGEATADTPEAARERVRELVDAGAGVIKVCAGGGVLLAEAERDACECDAALLEAIVDEAHRLGCKVAAHAQGPAAIERASAAGVDSIEHGGLADGAVLTRLAERRTFLVPTLARIDVMIEGAEQAGAPQAQLDSLLHARELAYGSTAAAVKAGVRIALGTDASVLPHGSNARELRALVEAGLSPLEALRAATIHAAELLGWTARVGALEPGLLADAIAVQGNPLEDVGALERVVFVMKGGTVVKGPGIAGQR